MTEAGDADPELIRKVQEAASRALPAEHVEHADGWWLRHTAASSWWAGSVQPHAVDDLMRLRSRVEEAERFYARYGAEPRFQIAPPVCPPELDGLLAGRGYRHSGPMSLRTATVATVLGNAPERPLRVFVAERHTPEWAGVWHAAHGVEAGTGGEEALYERVRLPSGYARAELDGGVVAVGRAVVDDGWAGVFSMATLPRARGRAAARSVLAALAGWAAGRGADRMYLQVEGANVAASRLYERMGFAALCEYHYRLGAVAGGV